MNFIEALRQIKILGTEDSDFIMESKARPKGGVMFRVAWDSNFPIKYLWITEKNMLVYSIGNGMSAPMLMNVEDYLADDWEIADKEKE